MRALRIMLGLAVIGLIAAGIATWYIRGPGPLAFAGGPKVALADYRGANPTGVPASLAKADAVTRGEYLARAADCTVCHTAPGEKEYAGGLGFKLPFGTLYSTNITPDKATMDLINATGCDAGIMTPAKTAERIRADYEKWGKVVREANIRAE